MTAPPRFFNRREFILVFGLTYNGNLATLQPSLEITKKNPRNLTEKLALKKYDPVVKKHVEFKEAKIK